MIKRLVLISLVLAFATWAWASDAAKTNADRSIVTAKKFDKDLISKTETARQPVTIYSTDFETEGEWEVLQLGTTGPVLQWVDDNSHSPSHSYWVPDDTPMTEGDALNIETAIVSPVIDLPAEIDGYPPKVLQMTYWFDVETANTTESSSVYDVWQMEVEVPYQGDNFWHTDTYQGFEGTSSWWCGDPSNGTYRENWRQELITPVLDLSAATGAVMLTFKNAPSSEIGYDYCYLEISDNDGLTWTRLDRWDEENDPLVWYDESYDISTYASATTIVKWRFTSDGGYQSATSWHIDNVEITDGTTQFLFDDGGDTSTELVAVEQPLSWVRMHYDYDDESRWGAGWFQETHEEISTFNGGLDLLDYAGMSVRFRIRVSTDGWNRLGLQPGNGFYFDDVEIFGQGVAQIDGAFAGVGGLFAVAPHNPVNAKVYIRNEGLNPISNIVWVAQINDELGEKVGTMQGRYMDTIEVGDVVPIETVEAARWTPMKPGEYTFEILQIIIPNDGYAPNNMPEEPISFIVHGPPYTELLYAEDFEAYGAADELEDFGWTVVNGGGNDLTGLNVNKWEYIGMIFGDGAATLSAFWGVVDPGSELAPPPDSSEVLEEYLISPPIDVSMLGKHNTLFVHFYEYFRSGYPGYDDFGVAHSNFTLDWSADDGETWHNVFTWVDDDSLPGNGQRLPNHFPGGTGSTYDHIDLDITPALLAAKISGSETVLVRFGTWCENSWFVASSLDNVAVYAGVSQPIMLCVDDVPEDQGKAVHLTFKGSYNDMLFQLPVEPVGDIVSVPVLRYDVWRLDDIDCGEVWTYLASVPASDHKVYGLVAPTLLDGVETEFVVEAKTALLDVWSMSAPMAGMSEDNLAPEAPGGLLAYGEDDKNVVAWEEAYTPVDDVKYYSVYRSTTAGSYPSEPIATTTELVYEDTDVVVNTKYYYVVTATDFAGNESENSNETEWTTGVIGSGSAAVPTDYALSQNYPNPFNPTTTIEFAVPEASDVTLKVFNVSGQEIASLVNNRMAAGYHKVTWNASDVSGGLYIIEMKAGNFVKTMKMVLAK